MSIGYICCLFTCGLSFCLPQTCITDAEEQLQNQIDEYNIRILLDKGYKLSYHKKCSTSWLQIDEIGKEIAKMEINELLKRDVYEYSEEETDISDIL